jgi:lipopolysaccharide/colanic/teichoic acid biosynthesis glycosyltransferase
MSAGEQMVFPESAARPRPLALETATRPARRRARTTARAFTKRTFDLAVSAVGLLIVLPLIVLIALLVRIDSAGPAFFRCERVGWRRRTLKMLKFRKMRDHVAGSALTLDDDERFTRTGRWLAKLKIDELPQLWHVLRGEMSLVGPRPESPVFVARFDDAYDVILGVRPGIVGLAQLAFADESRVLDHEDPVGDYLRRILPQKVALDTLYVAQQSIALDLRILFWSIVAVLFRRDVAVNRTTGRLSPRRR